VENFLKNSSLQGVDLVIINPPRRGLSAAIREDLLSLAPSSIIYSSCDPETFSRDIENLATAYTLKVFAPFDMFPLTSHCEVLGILEKR
jgi:tRNA/tmRNA/rRNA uracil-C5-methylase (TrmA/RlmC/RlmD family)